MLYLCNAMTDFHKNWHNNPECVPEVHCCYIVILKIHDIWWWWWWWCRMGRSNASVVRCFGFFLKLIFNSRCTWDINSASLCRLLWRSVILLQRCCDFLTFFYWSVKIHWMVMHTMAQLCQSFFYFKHRRKRAEATYMPVKSVQWTYMHDKQ